MTRLPLLLLLLLVPAAPVRADGPVWVPPVAGPLDVRRAFDPPRTPYGPGHRGVDLRAPEGAVVRAAGAGRVSFAGLLAGRGVVVVVHGDLRTTYEPLAAGVSVGDRVAAGEPLGLLERGHSPCGSCLHWGLRRGPGADAPYLDPLSLLRRGPSVLLPLTAADRDLARAARLAAEPAPVTAPASPAAGRPDPAVAHPPTWSLRSADLPLGAGALLALVAGVVLLARRPGHAALPAPDPDDPPVAPALAVPVRAPDDGAGAPAPAVADGLVDLQVERARRREPEPATRPACRPRRTASGWAGRGA